MATIIWLRHASVLIEGAKRVYIDPWELKEAKQADLVLVTHDHFDHLSAPDLVRVCGAATELVVPEAARDKLGGVPSARVHAVKPGQKITAAGLEVEAVASYNIGKKFHPRAAGNVGYVVTVDGERIYHAGDSDRIPEMKGLRPDVALLPIGGTYTMTAEEAALAAADLEAKRAIPIHFGAIVGGDDDARRFKKLCKIPVEIMSPAG
jgi:L-ascorbate metabolism protein UlaG (beta-lactamase superfamily)